MEATMHLVLVIRKGKVLARPTGTEPVPTLDEIENFLVPIERKRYGELSVISSFTGKIPDGWRWLEFIELQSETEEDVSMLGEALLCA
jgi:hypothetical protein